jgi:hypothetical protein
MRLKIRSEKGLGRFQKQLIAKLDKDKVESKPSPKTNNLNPLRAFSSGEGMERGERKMEKGQSRRLFQRFLLRYNCLYVRSKIAA